MIGTAKKTVPPEIKNTAKAESKQFIAEIINTMQKMNIHRKNKQPKIYRLKQGEFHGPKFMAKIKIGHQIIETLIDTGAQI